MDDFLEKLKKDRDAVKAKEAAEYDAKLRQRNEAAAAAKKQTGQSGYTDVMQGEIYRLAEQRRQAQVDLDMETMNDLDARMAFIRASAGKQTFGDRVSDVLSTAASRTGNAIASAVGTVSNAYNDPDYNRRQIAQAQFDYQKQQDALARDLSLQKLYAANQPKPVETPVAEGPGAYQVDTSQLSSAGRGLWNIIKRLGDNAAAASGRVQTYLNDGRISEQEADMILKYFGY